MSSFINILCILLLLQHRIDALEDADEAYVSSEGIDEAIVAYFSKHTNYLNIQIRLSYGESKPWQNNIMDRLTEVLTKHGLNMSYGIALNTVFRETRAISYNLLYLDSYEALKPILRHYRLQSSDTIGSYFIQLKFTYTTPKNTTDQLYMDEIRRIFKLMFEYNVINVIVVFRNAQKKLLVYGYTPFQDQCRSTEPVLTNSYNGTHFVNAELFPHKLRNFHGCKMRVFARNVEPFFFYDEKNPKNTQYQGIEAEILKHVARQLNFSIDLYREFEPNWGDIFTNGTMTGPYRLLQQNKVDMLLGYFSYANLSVHSFSESETYLVSSIMPLVKKCPKQSRRGVNWFVEPFQLETWLLLLGYIFLVMIFIKVSAMLSTNYTFVSSTSQTCTWIDVFGFLLGLAQTVVPARSALRFAIMMSCFGFTVFNATYQAKLFESYRYVPYHNTKNIDDLIRNNYTFILRSSVDNAFTLKELNIPPERVQFESTNDPNRIYELVLNSKSNTATLASVLRIFIYYMRSRKVWGKFELVPQKVRLQQMCAYFRRHSFLLRPFNEIIGKMRQGGLIKKWFRNFYYTHLSKASYEIKSKPIGYPKPLDLLKFKAVFIVFVCLNFLAFCVLIVEICYYKFRQRRQRSKVRIQLALQKSRT